MDCILGDLALALPDVTQRRPCFGSLRGTLYGKDKSFFELWQFSARLRSWHTRTVVPVKLLCSRRGRSLGYRLARTLVAGVDLPGGAASAQCRGGRTYDRPERQSRKGRSSLLPKSVPSGEPSKAWGECSCEWLRSRRCLTG